MATWSDVETYVKGHYKVADERPGMLKLIFEVGDLRSQVVLLWHVTLRNGEEEWLQIESPFAELGKVDLEKVLNAVGETVCGGAAVAGNHLTFRHSVPLASVDISEFERPLHLVVGTADDLEKMFSGGDAY